MFGKKKQVPSATVNPIQRNGFQEPALEEDSSDKEIEELKQEIEKLKVEKIEKPESPKEEELTEEKLKTVLENMDAILMEIQQRLITVESFLFRHRSI